ncbi:hypothetical protein EWM64_g3890 [Hericium alpestre]|uniref:YDG domain-containing protein n=1 Tax=Hericium alpestre TaxID=135208 RepID=A0A4Y9ZYZ2_9AGAM|nr:hypothetical protein EWM64_g3890 [Hericium alpestre]
MPTPYELERLENIKRNRALLEALKIEQYKPPKPAQPEKRKVTKKRKASPTVTTEESPDPVKSSRTDASDSPATGLRRSQRNAGKSVDYLSIKEQRQPLLVSKIGIDHDTEPNRRSGKRMHDPKVFGSIPGIEVGTWWETSNDAIHAPWVGGISGSSSGAYSIALSGGYEDDVDLGYAFTFTGSGGRDLKGTKNAPKNLRTAPQSSDQTFENHFNMALKKSSETKKPVRVIRGYKLNSPYAPAEGYRYDGLYIVAKAWREKGMNPKGYLVCKFALQRLPGQPPLPSRTKDETGEDSADGDEDSADGNEDSAEGDGDSTDGSAPQSN